MLRLMRCEIMRLMSLALTTLGCVVAFAPAQPGGGKKDAFRHLTTSARPPGPIRASHSILVSRRDVPSTSSIMMCASGAGNGDAISHPRDMLRA